MRKAAVKHPIVTSVFIVIIFFMAIAAGSLMLWFAPKILRSSGDLAAQFTAETVVCLVGIAVMYIFGYGKKFYNTSGFGTGVACSAFFIVIYLFSMISSLVYEFQTRGAEGFIDGLLPAWKIAFWPLATLAIGFAEECFYRGVVANLFYDKHAKDPAGVWTAALYSGLVFGLMHITNVLTSEPSGVFVQITAVISMGVAMTAVYYRCKNIWVMILLHAFMDFTAMASLGLFGGDLSADIGNYSILTAITSSLPYIIVALFLLRKNKTIEIITGTKPSKKVPTYVPSPNGDRIVVGMDMPSSPESKKSLRIAVIVVVIVSLTTFGAAIVTDPGLGEALYDITGAYILDYQYQDEWTPGDEITVGRGTEFEVQSAGNYEITLITMPSSSKVDMVMQITDKNGEEYFSSTYGGKCTTTFGLYLDEGTYDVKLVYSFANLTDPCTIDTTVKLRKV